MNHMDGVNGLGEQKKIIMLYNAILAIAIRIIWQLGIFPSMHHIKLLGFGFKKYIYKVVFMRLKHEK